MTWAPPDASGDGDKIATGNIGDAAGQIAGIDVGLGFGIGFDLPGGDQLIGQGRSGEEQGSGAQKETRQ